MEDQSTSAHLTGKIYLVTRHPQRRHYRGERRRPSRLAQANPIWFFLAGILALLAANTLIVLYARNATGSWLAAFADIFAVMVGLIGGWGIMTGDDTHRALTGEQYRATVAVVEAFRRSIARGMVWKHGDAADALHNLDKVFPSPVGDPAGLPLLEAMRRDQMAAWLKVRGVGLNPTPGTVARGVALDHADALRDAEDPDADLAAVLPDGARHAMPDLDGTVPCCGRNVHGLPAGDWTTAAAGRVTCTGSADV